MIKVVFMELHSETGLTRHEIEKLVADSLEGMDIRKMLIIPPDYTRMYSGAGIITNIIYCLMKDRCDIDIMPAPTFDSCKKRKKGVNRQEAASHLRF